MGLNAVLKACFNGGWDHYWLNILEAGSFLLIKFTL